MVGRPAVRGCHSGRLGRCGARIAAWINNVHRLQHPHFCGPYWWGSAAGALASYPVCTVRSARSCPCLTRTPSLYVHLVVPLLNGWNVARALPALQHLPDAVVRDILTLLPAPACVRLLSTCKVQWCAAVHLAARDPRCVAQALDACSNDEDLWSALLQRGARQAAIAWEHARSKALIACADFGSVDLLHADVSTQAEESSRRETLPKRVFRQQWFVRRTGCLWLRLPA